jgi:hypothetical protein
VTLRTWSNSIAGVIGRDLAFESTFLAILCAKKCCHILDMFFFTYVFYFTVSILKALQEGFGGSLPCKRIIRAERDKPEKYDKEHHKHV